MSDSPSVEVAIVDYGLGNLFSVKHACEHVGLAARIASDRPEILRAAAVILPGVGAFGDAMFPERHFREVMEYIEMKPERFSELCDEFRSPHLWKRESGEWKLRHRVT